MTEVKHYSLVKPTVNTPFQIDFDWWKLHDNNWRVFLLSLLCPEHQAVFTDAHQDVWLDWVDPETAEVKPVDGLQHILVEHCARQPGFLTINTTMVDTVFRVLLSHGNRPMTPLEISAETKRPAETILRTLSGQRVYQGIRPRQA